MPTKDLQQLYKQYNISREASTTHLGGWQVVWELGPDKKLTPFAVQVGITDYNNTQLLQGNLKEGDLLVTTEQVAKTSGTAGAQRPPGFGGGQGGPR